MLEGRGMSESAYKRGRRKVRITMQSDGEAGEEFRESVRGGLEAVAGVGRLPVSLSVPSVPTSPMLNHCPRGERLGCKGCKKVWASTKKPTAAIYGANGAIYHYVNIFPHTHTSVDRSGHITRARACIRARACAIRSRNGSKIDTYHGKGCGVFYRRKRG